MATRSRYTGIQTQVGTRSYQGPSGIGMREAQRTSQMLTTALDGMSNYFFKKAGQQAEIAGAEYGAENPITVEQINESSLNGTDVADRFDDDTIFGRSAKKIALESLGADLQLSANRQMSDLITLATTNGSDLSEVGADLKGIVNEYVKIAGSASPILARKLYATLGMSSSGLYTSYSKVFAKKQIDQLQIKGTLSLNYDLKQLPIEFGGIFNGEFNEEELTAKIYGSGLYKDGVRLNDKNINSKEFAKSPGFYFNKKKSYMQKGMVHKFTETMIKSSAKDWDGKWLEARTSFIVTEGLESGNSSDVAQKIHKGQKTGNVKIDAILNGMNDQERLDVAKAIRTEKTSAISFEKTIQDNLEISTDQIANELIVSITKDLAFGIDNSGATQANIDKLEQLGKFKEAGELQIKLNESGGLRTVSDPIVLSEIKAKISSDNFSFGDLLAKSDDLSSKDYNELATKVEANENAEFKSAMVIVAGDLGFSPEADILGEKDPNFEKQQVYRRIRGKVEEALLLAKKDNKNFDAVAIARNVLSTEQDGIQQQLFDNDYKSTKGIINLYDQEYPGQVSKSYSKAEIQTVLTKLLYLSDDKNKKQRTSNLREQAIINAYISQLQKILTNPRLQ